ncbi:hypothetical protein FNF31_03933 [Cafeteria roenbergensis]|uniref:TFIIS N-terminal domain-containing protein n=1 Tax=Cafeteria roenbergensis TaxID=33653 RepID=A0A5A8D6F3_CAFRO|nr:hypothetical protein FNF31_03933 [Cafeteria roenbergensis]KAA0170893.1 hypothetical protein FNF28_01166 [Cafeteria roenbergensis]
MDDDVAAQLAAIQDTLASGSDSEGAPAAKPKRARKRKLTRPTAAPKSGKSGGKRLKKAAAAAAAAGAAAGDDSDEDDFGDDAAGGMAAELASLRQDAGDALQLEGRRRRVAAAGDGDDSDGEGGGSVPPEDAEPEGEVAEAGRNGRGTKGGTGARASRGKLSDDDKEALSRAILEKMALAAQEDKQARAKGLPAVRKLALLPEVRLCLNNPALHAALLEGVSDDTSHSARGTGGHTSILAVLHEWLRPLRGSRLPELTVRSTVYKLLFGLPVTDFHLRSSKIAPVLLALRIHPEETSANKLFLQRILDSWARVVLNRSSSLRNAMGYVLRAEQESYARSGIDVSKASQHDPIPGMAATGPKQGEAARDADLLFGDNRTSAAGAAAAAAEPTSLLARRPVAVGLNFLHRVERPMGVEVDGAAVAQGEGSGAGMARGTADKDGNRAKLKRQRQALRRAKISKTTSDHKISIEGRRV